MAKTVNGAFNEFLKNTVNLDKEETKIARNSKNWLLDQIAAFKEDTTFPLLAPEYNIQFGSFARKTKIRPLDDIDLMIGLHANGASYDSGTKGEIIIKALKNTTLYNFCDYETDILNSVKIINKFLSNLKDVPQYKNAEIKRNKEAATLSLKSYDWVYDIVPCFYTAPDHFGKTYYIIPDGSGNWKKTNPRIDRDRTQNVNQQHLGRVLNIIRIIKYWNKRPTMPTMSSYLLETMLLNYYASKTSEASEFVDLEIPPVLNYIKNNIYSVVNDPKNIQGNINSLSWEDRVKIANRAQSDKEKAEKAREYERNGDNENSIKKWREFFGDKFPEYE